MGRRAEAREDEEGERQSDRAVALAGESVRREEPERKITSLRCTSWLGEGSLQQRVTSFRLLKLEV